MNKLKYEDCSKYVKNVLRVKLFDYQEVMLKAFCDGLEVRTARGIGRSEVAKVFGEYIASLVGDNNYDKEPDIIIPYTSAVKSGVLSSEFVEHIKSRMSAEDFKREYC